MKKYKKTYALSLFSTFMIISYVCFFMLATLFTIEEKSLLNGIMYGFIFFIMIIGLSITMVCIVNIIPKIFFKHTIFIDEMYLYYQEKSCRRKIRIDQIKYAEYYFGYASKVSPKPSMLVLDDGNIRLEITSPPISLVFYIKEKTNLKVLAHYKKLKRYLIYGALGGIAMCFLFNLLDKCN